MCMTQVENNLAFRIIFNENKIPITVKISMYFLSSIAFKTYQSQYKSKYSIRFTQRLIEGKNFLIFRYLEHSPSRTFLLVSWEFEITDVHCILETEKLP